MGRFSPWSVSKLHNCLSDLCVRKPAPQKCIDALIHCQVKQIFYFFFFFFIQETLMRLWLKEMIEEKLKMNLGPFSNNTSGRSTPTYCERYSQWERENETQSYGCLCRIPSGLISLEAIVWLLHRKKAMCQSSQRRKCSFPQGLCSMCCWLTNNQLCAWHLCW